MVIARYSNVHFVRKTVIQAKPNQRFFLLTDSQTKPNTSQNVTFMQDIFNLPETFCMTFIDTML